MFRSHSSRSIAFRSHASHSFAFDSLLAVSALTALALSASACSLGSIDASGRHDAVNAADALARRSTPRVPVGPEGNRGIIGGRGVVAGDVGAKSTVALYDFRRAQLCTGTLVSADLVVTAGHCLLEGAMTHVVFGESVSDPASVARRIIRRASLLAREENYPNDDVAWVRFTGAVPAGYEPARLLVDASVLERGQALRLVGYGKIGDGPFASSGTRRTVETVFGGFVTDTRFRDLLFVGPNPGKGNCFGDSGGPAYAKVKGEWRLVSTLSGLEETLTPSLDCAGGHTIHNLVGPRKAWIEETSGVRLPE